MLFMLMTALVLGVLVRMKALYISRARGVEDYHFPNFCYVYNVWHKVRHILETDHEFYWYLTLHIAILLEYF